MSIRRSVVGLALVAVAAGVAAVVASGDGGGNGTESSPPQEPPETRSAGDAPVAPRPHRRRVEPPADAVATTDAADEIVPIRPSAPAAVDERVQRRVHELLAELIAQKVTERRFTAGAAEDALPREPPPRGSLAAALRWAHRELPDQLCTRISEELGLSREEFERHWNERLGRELRPATYGTGSFVVIRKRPAGSTTSPEPDPTPAKEEWWDDASLADRAAWLLASFVETSGMFEIARASDDPCPTCRDYASEECPTCTGAGRVRRVIYR